MTVVTPDELQRSVLFMRNAAPEQFDRFMRAFEVYVDDNVYAVTEAALDEVTRMQGRALALRGLLRIFQECDRRPKNG